MSYCSGLIWMILIPLTTFSRSQVAIDPPGPLYLPVPTQRNITCLAEGGRLDSFLVIFSDREPVEYVLLDRTEAVTGIVILSAGASRSLVSVKTNDTSITGIRCDGIFQSGGTDRYILNLTIYGAPDPPAITSLSLEGNSLRSSWDYVRIPTVDVTLYWSVSFFRPSQLSDITTALLNTSTYNYTLQGVRSCDPFRLCIRAGNEVGNSSRSCNNSALPYLPRREDIEYSLVQVNEALSLNVTVVVPQECQSSMNTYCLSVSSAEGSEVAMSRCVRSNEEYIHVLVEKLVWNTSYNFSVISNNSLGQQSTAAMSFYTNNVESVDICSLFHEQVYQISCRYVSGAARTGCSYQLTGTNSSIINIELMREEYSLHKTSDINCCYTNIIVRNSDHYVVVSGTFSTFSIMPCQATTVATAASARPDSTACPRNDSCLTIIITVGAIIGVQIMLCVLTPFITIFTYKKFFINPKKESSKGSPTFQEKDCSENPAYGVMPLSSSSSNRNRGNTNVLPEYEVIDLETKK